MSTLNLPRFALSAFFLSVPLTVAVAGVVAATRGGPTEVSAGGPIYGDVGEVYEGVQLTAPVPVPVVPVARKSHDGKYGAAQDKGINWLLAAQQKSGGWASGAWGQEDTNAVPDVATTAVAVQALMRDAGSSQQHRDSIERGVLFVANAVETGPRNSPRVAGPEGTQPQAKLGAMVDTHMAAMLLAEVSGRFGADTNRKVSVALDTAVGKVQLAQNADGSFETGGWAPILSNSIAAQSLIKAKEAGADVAPSAIAKADDYQNQQVAADGSFKTEAGAGVELYSLAYNMRADSDKARRGVMGSGSASAAATAKVSGASADQLIAGFGSVGGEEMMSYMLISDTLSEKGGKDWENWQARIGDYLLSIQNSDGSWAGHHCITSRTFVTATALMTLGAGEPVPAVGRLVPREPTRTVRPFAGSDGSGLSGSEGEAVDPTTGL
jgi:Prenyltransferase and squalene oxidase repeat